MRGKDRIINEKKKKKKKKKKKEKKLRTQCVLRNKLKVNIQ